MIDYGHEKTDKRLKKLEKRLTKKYKTAEKELTEKMKKYLDRFAEKDANKAEQLKAGLINKDEYLTWRKNAMLTGNKYREVRDTISHDLLRVNQISTKMITNEMIDAYALNANFAMYEVEKGLGTSLSFSLYNHDLVERMIQSEEFPIPVPRMDIPKDLLWNKKKINSAMLQGVLQGESIPKIAKRLRKVTDMNRTSAIRNARTYITGAENRGRVDSYKYAESLGIELEQMWLATLDGRTRDSHRYLDGMTVKVGEEFPNGCEYPGDPDGPPEEIYNCRCSLVADIKGFSSMASDLSWRNSSKMEESTYEDWKVDEMEYKKWERSKRGK